MAKVEIISGFLGAGKTTFIKELLSKVFNQEKVVLIENEFGEMGIDSRFLKDTGIEVTEMNSGCICCTLAGDFTIALKKVMEQYNPDRIIIEPSGVGKLSDVTKAVANAGLKVNSSITIVDGKKAIMYGKNFGEFFNDQVENASTIVVSRSQLISQEALENSVKMLKGRNPEAKMITTPWDQLAGDQIGEAISQVHVMEEQLMGKECCQCSCGCNHDDGHNDHDHHHHEHHHHHHADEMFTSWSSQTIRKFTRQELEDLLKMMTVTDQFGQILRAKGILQGEDGTWMEFDLACEEIQIRKCSPDYTGRLCVIGTKLKEVQLKEAF
ncbi:MAG: GTP-binding protein [Anaerovoracaceae bacterium]